MHRGAPHQQHGPPLLQPRLHSRLEPGDQLLHAHHRWTLHGLLLCHLPGQCGGRELRPCRRARRCHKGSSGGRVPLCPCGLPLVPRQNVGLPVWIHRGQQPLGCSTPPRRRGATHPPGHRGRGVRAGHRGLRVCPRQPAQRKRSLRHQHGGQRLPGPHPFPAPAMVRFSGGSRARHQQRAVPAR